MEPQLRKHEAGEGAWPFPLVWASGESALNPCLWGGTQAKAILGLYLLEVAGACCISSKHGLSLAGMPVLGGLERQILKTMLRTYVVEAE